MAVAPADRAADTGAVVEDGAAEGVGVTAVTATDRFIPSQR